MPELRNGQYMRSDIPALPGADGTVRNSNVLPRFFMDYRRNKQKPEELLAVEMVQILIAGDTKNAPVRKVTDFHRHQWPAAYEAFKRNEEFIGEGTPVSAWGAIDAGVARSLQALQIFTVEQLADIPDTALSQMIGGRTLRDKAKQFVELTTRNTEVNRVNAAMQAVKDENRALQQQVSDLATRLSQISPQEPESLANQLDSAIDDAPEEEEPHEVQSLAQKLGTKPASKPRGRPKGSRNKPKET